MSAAYSTGTAATIDALYQTMRALMTANGWTELDVISDASANRDIVFQGAALDATAQNYIYLRFTLSGTTWSHRVYTDWDTGTNVGAKEAGVNGQTSFTIASSPYWIRVNEFSVAMCVKISATYYKMYAGYLRRGLPNSKNGLTRTTSAYSAGVLTMNVASDMTGRLKVGQKVVIYNHGHSSGGANFSNSELVVIQTIASGSITFAGPTTFAYDIGAVIGWNPNPATAFYWSQAEDLTSYGSYGTMFHDSYWATNTTVGVAAAPVILASESYADPDDISLEYQGGVVACYFTTAGRTGFHGYLYHWEGVAGGTQAKEDTMSDGANTFVILATGVNSCYMLGPT